MKLLNVIYEQNDKKKNDFSLFNDIWIDKKRAYEMRSFVDDP